MTSGVEKEGYANVLGLKIFYRLFGGTDQRKGTVVCLHGGPGLTHDYMKPLSDLVQFGYSVLLYDEIGCGKSELPKNKKLFTAERHVEELENLRRGLGLGRIHLIGHSWGGMFGMAYALKYQENLKSLVLSGATASTPLCLSEMDRLRSELPGDAQQTLIKWEEEGDYENPEYIKASEVFLKKHFCRLPEWPPELNYSLEHLSKPVYQTMWGPNEFVALGALRYWDITNDIHKIKLPCLITCGRYDELTELLSRGIEKEIKDSKFVMFENSAHMTMWDERENYLDVVSDFLRGVA